MYLTLEITGSEAARFGAQRRHTFDIEGGRIGRAPDNEWVIADQYIHGVHAVVRFMGGLFFVEKHGQNRVAVNRPDLDLPPNQPFPLKDGDRLFLDEYELSVKVARTPPPKAPAPAVSAPSPTLDPITGSRAGTTAAPPLLEGDLEQLDPLDHLGGPLPQRRSAAAEHSVLTHGSVLSDSFRPPAPMAASSAAAAPAASFIPEDWDRTSMSRWGARTAAPPSRAEPLPPASSAPPLRTPQPPAARAPGAAVAPGSLASALGVAGAELSAGELETLGRALRSCLAGVIELAQVRSQIRARLRIAPARAAPADVNALRNAANVDDALHELFQRRRAGSMPADVAVADSLDEERRHQLAMLQAMRAAFDALMARLDPAAHAERGDAGGKRGALLGLPARIRQWDSYLEYFRAQLGADPEEAFRRLFGTDFAAAYEKELERLATLDRHRGAPA